MFKLGHLHLVMVFGPILLISGHFNRRVLYYNVISLYYIFTILIVTLIVQYYKNVLYEHTIHYVSQVLPDCSSCVPALGSSSQSNIEILGGFSRHQVCELGAKELKDCHQRLESDVNSTYRFWGLKCKETLFLYSFNFN